MGQKGSQPKPIVMSSRWPILPLAGRGGVHSRKEPALDSSAAVVLSTSSILFMYYSVCLIQPTPPRLYSIVADEEGLIARNPLGT